MVTELVNGIIDWDMNYRIQWMTSWGIMNESKNLYANKWIKQRIIEYKFSIIPMNYLRVYVAIHSLICLLWIR